MANNSLEQMKLLSNSMRIFLNRLSVWNTVPASLKLKTLSEISDTFVAVAKEIMANELSIKEARYHLNCAECDDKDCPNHVEAAAEKPSAS